MYGAAPDLETQAAPKVAKTSLTTKVMMASMAVVAGALLLVAARSLAVPAREPLVGGGYSMAGVRPSFTMRRAMAPTGRFAARAPVGNSGLGMKAAPSVRPQVKVNVEKKMSVKDLGEADLKDKVALVRCDLNVPLDGKTITDDTRIRASVPTIKYLLEKGAKLLLTSHLGRPKDGPEDKFSLAPVAARLSELLGQDVIFVKDCIGEPVKEAVASMKPGSVALLENVRFYKEETKNDAEFAKKLAENADLFVNDAFGTAHRAHGSTEGVTNYLKPSVAGFLLEKELEYLEGAVAEPARPFAAIVGGSKVSSKIGVIESLLEKVDKLIIGGGMVFTFLKARGLEVGSSLA
uniref:Phosphoglycerate kinase n=1 Tax=Gymnochlora stellata TaxID=67809 RepID=B5A4I9_GYMST|nr:phosphoglycerate kinase 1 [Gymnochlora stellata]